MAAGVERYLPMRTGKPRNSPSLLLLRELDKESSQRERLEGETDPNKPTDSKIICATGPQRERTSARMDDVRAVRSRGDAYTHHKRLLVQVGGVASMSRLFGFFCPPQGHIICV